MGANLMCCITHQENVNFIREDAYQGVRSETPRSGALTNPSFAVKNRLELTVIEIEKKITLKTENVNIAIVKTVSSKNSYIFKTFFNCIKQYKYAFYIHCFI